MKKLSRRGMRSRRRALLLLGTLTLWTLMLITCAYINQEVIVDNAYKIFTQYLVVSDDISCYRENLEYPDETFEKADVNFNDNSIFVISATCNHILTLHESCVIESVIRNNKGMDVYVLLTNDIHLTHYYEREENSVDYIRVYVNRMFKINIDNFVYPTPAQGIFTNKFLKIRTNRHKRVREVLKLAALYRFGGVVVDLEMLLAAPTSVLGHNGAAKIANSLLGGAILALDKGSKIGKLMLEKSFVYLNKGHYDLDLDAGYILTRAFVDLCLSEKPLTECADFIIYEPKYFYPFNSTENYKYFEPGFLDKDVYGYYFWDRKYDRLKYDSLYLKLAQEHCPNVHELLGSRTKG